MRLESRKFLEDVRQAIELILQFAESEKLESQIRRNLKELGCGG